MTDTESTPVADLVHRKVIDPAGDKVGTVFDVYLDNSTGQPEWLAVTTGLFGTKVSFVPVAGATMIDDDVMVAYPKDTVKDAPRAEADGELSADEEAALFTHYDVRSDAADQNGTGQGGTEARVGEDRTTGADEADQGHDTGGPNTDDAMTRSEEQLDVTTGTRESGKVRLRKWIETENVHMTVPVRRQKARVVVEPVTDANRDAAYAGGDLTTEEHEVVLSEEVVDVSKSVVAKERVRLETEVETGEVEVDEEVRTERIAMEGDDEPEGSGR